MLNKRAQERESVSTGVKKNEAVALAAVAAV